MCKSYLAMAALIRVKLQDSELYSRGYKNISEKRLVLPEVGLGLPEVGFTWGGVGFTDGDSQTHEETTANNQNVGLHG